MQVKRLAWLGTRTERHDETTAFFRDTLGLSVVHEEPGFAMLRLPGGDHDCVEVCGADDPDVAFYTTGPVVGLLVDDVEKARAELEAAGVELIGSIERSSRIEGYGWFDFRGPDGNVYGVLQGRVPCSSRRCTRGCGGVCSHRTSGPACAGASTALGLASPLP